MPVVSLAQRLALGRRGAMALGVRPGQAGFALPGVPANPGLIGPLISAFLKAKFLQTTHWGRLHESFQATTPCTAATKIME